MPAGGTRLAMPLHISLVGRKNLSREIHRQILDAILDGRLRPGDRLSSSRELADALNVSRMTVNVAYERLAGEGFIVTRQRGGTFVSELVAQAANGAVSRRRDVGVIQVRPEWREISLPTIFSRPAR